MDRIFLLVIYLMCSAGIGFVGIGLMPTILQRPNQESKESRLESVLNRCGMRCMAIGGGMVFAAAFLVAVACFWGILGGGGDDGMTENESQYDEMAEDGDVGSIDDPTVCSDCGAELHVGDWPHCPHGSTLPRWAQLATPITIHVAADGSLRFPASSDAPIPAGFERRELRTLREMESLERRVNREQAGEHERHLAREHSTIGAEVEARHKELLHEMRSMSPKGRALAEAAIAHNEAKRRARPQFQAGFHIEALHYDASNREPQRDITTGWKPRKA